MTSRELQSIKELIEEAIKGQKCAVHETWCLDMKADIKEIKQDIKHMKDNHGNRLTKLETEKKTTIAVVGAVVAFLFSVFNFFK